MVLDDPTNLRHLPRVDEEPDVLLDGDEPGDMRLSWSMSFAEQRERVPSNRDGRFVVLSAAVGRWLRNESRAWHQPLSLAEVDAHLVHKEEPALAAAVVRAVVEAARRGRPVTLDADLLASVSGRLAHRSSAEHRR